MPTSSPTNPHESLPTAGAPIATSQHHLLPTAGADIVTDLLDLSAGAHVWVTARWGRKNYAVVPPEGGASSCAQPLLYLYGRDCGALVVKGSKAFHKRRASQFTCVTPELEKSRSMISSTTGSSTSQRRWC
jgi:hypothetical protein